MNSTNIDEKQRTVTRWMVEYAVSMVWNDFVRHKTVDRNNNRDLIQWIAGQCLTGNDEIQQTYLMSLLCRLNDGKNYMIKYNEDSVLTVLEDAAEVLQILIRDTEPSVYSAGEDLLWAMRQEAVFVCCRANNFDDAKEVFNRQFSSDSEEGKENKQTKEIQKMLKSKNPQHHLLTSHDYDDFLQHAENFLKHFIKKEKPYLLQMTEKKPKETTNNSVPAFRDKQVNLRLLTEVCEEMGGPKTNSFPNFMEQRALKEHLQKINEKKRNCTDTNLNANTDTASSPEKECTPKKRKHTSTEDKIVDTSLISRVQEKNNNLNPHAILNADLPKLKLRNSEKPSVYSPEKMRRPWLESEVDEFYQAVQICGVGNWNRIKDTMRTYRTNVQLKDKWRTILKTGEIKRLEKLYGDVKK